MSEIKGQLLGLVLVLLIFGAVSLSVAAVFRDSADKVTENYDGITSGATDVLSVN